MTRFIITLMIGVIGAPCSELSYCFSQQLKAPQILETKIVEVQQLNISTKAKDSLLQSYLKLAHHIGVDSIIGITEHRLGVLYFSKEEYKLALPHYDRAFNIFKRIPNVETDKLLRSGLWAGMSAEKSGELDLALTYYREVIGYPLCRYVVMTYREISKIYWLKKEFALSESFAIKAFNNLDSLRFNDIIELYLNYFGLLIEVQDLEKIVTAIDAASEYVEVIDTFIQKGNINNNNIFGFLQNLALLSELARDHDNCIKYNLMALKATEIDMYKGDILNNLSVAYLHLSHYAEAEQYAKKAEAIYRDLNDNNKRSSSYDNLGEVYLYQRSYKRAIAYFDSAIYLVSQEPGVVDPGQILPISAERKDRLATFVLDKGNAFELWYEETSESKFLNAALDNYKLADEILDQIRRSLAQDQSQFHWRQKGRDVYEPAVVAAVRANNDTLALRFADRAKALMLTEALQQNESASLIPDSLRLVSGRLAEEINHLEERTISSGLSNPTATQIAQKLQDSLLKTRERYTQLNSIIVGQFPEYFPEYSFTIDSIINALPGETEILSYFLTEESIYCGRISHSTVSFKRIGSRHRLDSLLLVFNQLMSEVEQIGRSGSLTFSISYLDHLMTFASTNYALYKLLLKPIDSLAHQLVVIGDENVNSLNFELLLTDTVDIQSPLRSWPFAIKDHCFTYNYSILSWLGLNKLSNASREIIGISPEFHDKYSPLEYSQKALFEVSGVEKRILEGPEANIKNIIGMQKCAVLDFQTHAVISQRKNPPPFIILNTQTGELDTIFMSEVVRLKVPEGVFVVLTACESHVGERVRGEGVISLARAFTYAGASGLITSLWKVDDYASAQIMSEFYKQLANGADKASALRNAKLHYLNNTSDERSEHPYYWASLIQIGNSSPLPPKSRLKYYLIGAGMILIVIWAGRRLLKGNTMPKAA